MINKIMKLNKGMSGFGGRTWRKSEIYLHVSCHKIYTINLQIPEKKNITIPKQKHLFSV